METVYDPTDITHLAPQPIQFEVKNWLFGHGLVVRSSVSNSRRDRKDGKNRVHRPTRGESKNEHGEAKVMAQRHTIHFGAPLEMESQGRSSMRKSHKSTHSCGHQQISPEYPREVKGMSWSNSPGGLPRGSLQIPGPVTMAAEYNEHNWYRRTLSQSSAQGWVPGKERVSFASSAGSGDTSLGSSTQFSSPPLTPDYLHFSGGSLLEPPFIPSQTAPSPAAPACSGSPAGDFPMTGISESPPSSPARASSTSLIYKRRSPNLNLCNPPTPSSRPSKPKPRPLPLLKSTMDDHSKMKLQKALRVFKSSKTTGKIILPACNVLRTAPTLSASSRDTAKAI